MGKYQDILELTFVEIHQHLRATDDKRDKMVNLFFLVVLAFISAFIAVIQSNKGAEISTGLVYLLIASIAFFVLFGHIVIRSEINARLWHVEYMNCSAVIQRLIRKKKVNAPLEEPFYSFTFEGISTRSMLTTNMALLFIQIMAALFFYTQLDFGSYDVCINTVVTLCLAFLLVWQFAHSNRIADEILSNAQTKFCDDPFGSWVLKGLEKKP